MDHEEKEDDEYKRERNLKKKTLMLCEKEGNLLCFSSIIYCGKKNLQTSQK
jgi:hypothetical protein